MRRAASLALALALLLASSALAAAPARGARGRIGPGDAPARAGSGRLDATDRWIVVLRNGATLDAATARAGRLGIARDRTFHSALRGYSARLTGSQLAALRADPDVA